MYILINPAVQKVIKYNVKKLCRLNILLAEDSLLNIKLVSILFLQNGLKLQVAQNGKEAVEKIRTNHFDIVLMDMEMPVMNGYQATAAIRWELKNNIPIIALTAHATAGEREKCLQLGMNGYISKPFNSNLLFKTIGNLACSSTHAPKKTGIAKSLKPSLISEKVCNMDYLINITRGNTKIINSIIKVFLMETPGELSALGDAIKKLNYPIISDISHKIKSAFSILGISVLEPVLNEMEYLGSTAKGIEKIVKLNRKVNAVFIQAIKEINQKN